MADFLVPVFAAAGLASAKISKESPLLALLPPKKLMPSELESSTEEVADTAVSALGSPIDFVERRPREEEAFVTCRWLFSDSSTESAELNRDSESACAVSLPFSASSNWWLLENLLCCVVLYCAVVLCCVVL